MADKLIIFQDISKDGDKFVEVSEATFSKLIKTEAEYLFYHHDIKTKDVFNRNVVHDNLTQILIKREVWLQLCQPYDVVSSRMVGYIKDKRFYCRQLLLECYNMQDKAINTTNRRRLHY